MSPLQTLVLVKQAIDLVDMPPDVAALLDGVDLPPQYLLNISEPETWALEWASRYQAPSSATAYAWLGAALQTGYGAGVAAGRAEGILQERQQRTSAHQLIVTRLDMVARLIETGRLRDLQMRGDTEGAPTRALSDLLREALSAAVGL